jgi:hypothetical protein
VQFITLPEFLAFGITDARMDDLIVRSLTFTGSLPVIGDALLTGSIIIAELLVGRRELRKLFLIEVTVCDSNLDNVNITSTVSTVESSPLVLPECDH